MAGLSPPARARRRAAPPPRRGTLRRARRGRLDDLIDRPRPGGGSRTPSPSVGPRPRAPTRRVVPARRGPPAPARGDRRPCRAWRSPRSSARCSDATASRARSSSGSTNLIGEEHVGGILLNARDVTERKAFEAQADPPGVPRHGDRAREPRAVHRARHATRSPAARARTHARGRSSSISTTSRRSTTRSATRSATRCWRGRRSASTARCAAPTPPPGFGGDEFAVLLEGIEPQEAAGDRRSASSTCSPRPFARPSARSRCAPARRLRRAPSDTRSAEELIRDADAAMYTAKRDGKGGYRAVRARDARRRAAPASSSQPTCERASTPASSSCTTSRSSRLGDGQIVRLRGAAALAPPERGIVSPVEFIPIAEETGPDRPDRALGAARGDRARRAAAAAATRCG